jgi:hypothetical protein
MTTGGDRQPDQGIIGVEERRRDAIHLAVQPATSFTERTRKPPAGVSILLTSPSLTKKTVLLAGSGRTWGGRRPARRAPPRGAGRLPVCRMVRASSGATSARSDEPRERQRAQVLGCRLLGARDPRQRGVASARRLATWPTDGALVIAT